MLKVISWRMRARSWSWYFTLSTYLASQVKESCLYILQLNKVGECELCEGEEDESEAANDVDVEGRAVGNLGLDVAYKPYGDNSEAAGHPQPRPGGAQGQEE